MRYQIVSAHSTVHSAISNFKMLRSMTNIQTLMRITTRQDPEICKPMHGLSPKKTLTGERKKNENVKNVNCARLLLLQASRCPKRKRVLHLQYRHLQHLLLMRQWQWTLSLVPSRRKEIGPWILLLPLLFLGLRNRAGQLSVHPSTITFLSVHRLHNQTLHLVGHHHRHLRLPQDHIFHRPIIHPHLEQEAAHPLTLVQLQPFNPRVWCQFLQPLPLWRLQSCHPHLKSHNPSHWWEVREVDGHLFPPRLYLQLLTLSLRVLPLVRILRFVNLLMPEPFTLPHQTHMSCLFLPRPNHWWNTLLRPLNLSVLAGRNFNPRTSNADSWVIKANDRLCPMITLDPFDSCRLLVRNGKVYQLPLLILQEVCIWSVHHTMTKCNIITYQKSCLFHKATKNYLWFGTGLIDQSQKESEMYAVYDQMLPTIPWLIPRWQS